MMFFDASGEWLDEFSIYSDVLTADGMENKFTFESVAEMVSQQVVPGAVKIAVRIDLWTESDGILRLPFSTTLRRWE